MPQPVPPTQLEPYQLIIRVTWGRSNPTDQQACLAEMRRRGLWLSDDQRRQAGL